MAVSSSGDEAMDEGTVTISTFDDTVPLATDDDTATSAPSGTTDSASTAPESTVPASTDVPSTTVAPTTTEVPTTPAPSTTVTATTLPPTTATPTLPPTLPTTTPPPTTAVPGEVILTDRCSSSTYGWEVGIADGWFAADESNEAWACAAFDRAPVIIDPDTEIAVAITITFIEVHYADAIAPYYEGDFAEVLSDTAATVWMYDAARLEVVSTGLGMYEEGALGIAYVVDRGGWSTVLIEGWGYGDADYAEVRAVVDAMAADIEFWDS